ncbi:MAG: prephenate dehydratase domain-containing protein [Patescibacteria group bacterium]
MKMCFLGPLGTNSHEFALRAKKFLESKQPPYAEYVNVDIELCPCKTNTEVLAMASREQCLGVVALENSTGGLVDETKQFWLQSDTVNPLTCVIGEFRLSVEHHLLAPAHVTDVSQLTAVMSHPQALLQCSRFFDTNPTIEKLTSTSTAAAAKTVSEMRVAQMVGAIAPRLSAEIYGLPILMGHLENSLRNTTRFHLLAPRPSPIYPTGTDRTAIIFETPDVSGALVDALNTIRPGGINLSSIHSIPLGEEDKFAFYCEFNRHRLDPEGSAILTRLQTLTSRLIVLGSFPQETKRNGGVK